MRTNPGANMMILPIATLLVASHASAIQDCSVDGMAASIVSSASPKELAVLSQEEYFDVDPLARDPVLARKAATLVENCRSALATDPDAHVRAMLSFDPSWIARASLLAANRKSSGSNAGWHEAVIGFAIDYLNTLPWPNPPEDACQPRARMKTVDVSFGQSEAWYTFRSVPYFACRSGGYEAYLPEEGWVKLKGMRGERLGRAANAVKSSSESKD